VAGERRLRILARLAGNAAPELERTKRLCEVCAEITEVTGAGIMLMSDDLPRGSICTTNDVSALLEQLQYTLGEGPCVDAYLHDRPVLEPDLAEPSEPRWLAFSPPAIEAGVRAIFGFPVNIGAIRLGALNLHRDSPGRLTDEQHRDALVVASVAAHVILSLQADAPPGKLAHELESGADFKYVVHQASGMVAVQLDVSVSQALVRLRAYSFGNDRPLATVAADVVNRALRFGDETLDQESLP
jgi:GAF domain-containing protein